MKRILCTIICLSLLIGIIPPCSAKGGICVTVNGTKVTFPDVEPQIIDGRTMIPARAVFEKLGYAVSWNASERSVEIKSDSQKLVIKIGSKTVKYNGKNAAQSLDVVAQIVDGRTLIPIRIPAEILGFIVTWDSDSRTVTIDSAGNSVAATNDDAYKKQIIKNANIIYDTLDNDYFTDSVKENSQLIQLLDDLNYADYKNDLLVSISLQTINCVLAVNSIATVIENTAPDILGNTLADACETLVTTGMPSLGTNDFDIYQYMMSASNNAHRENTDLIIKFFALHLKRSKQDFSFEEALSYILHYFIVENNSAVIRAAVKLFAAKIPDSYGAAAWKLAKEFGLGTAEDIIKLGTVSALSQWPLCRKTILKYYSKNIGYVDYLRTFSELDCDALDDWQEGNTRRYNTMMTFLTPKN